MIIKNNNKILNYVGTFETFKKENETVVSSNVKGSYIEFKFTGTGFKYYAHTNAWRGIANIYIDDVKKEEIDLYSQNEVKNVLLFEINNLDPKQHTVKIEVKGEKRSISKATKITLMYLDLDIVEEIADNTFIDTVLDLKKADFKIDDIVETKGYYTIGDRGNAKYIIKDYDYYLNEWLPFDCRKIGNEYNKLGTDRVLYDSPVDEFGNHTLDNGLIACLLDKENIRPEQYGAKAEEGFNNLFPFQHMFAHMKHGKIEFKSNSTYYIGQNHEGFPNGMKHNQVPYGVYMGGRGCNCIYPTMANIDGVELVGNNSEIKIFNNDCNNLRQGNDFSLLNLFRVIRNLTIHGIKFNNNGLTMDSTHSVENHGISWKAGNVTLNNNKIAPTVEDGTISEISNIEIYDCEFIEGGIKKAIQDCGGDGILIINPMENSHDINIHNNKFTNWGRWCFAIDLGGDGECIKNVKFNNNTCIQYETNINLSRKFRGLGWIDFEARKCFKNLEICNNYVKGCNGFAFNGNDKVSENITIKNNEIVRTTYGIPAQGLYPYMFNFYYVHAKNLIFEDNNLSECASNSRVISVNNASIKRNTFFNDSSSSFTIKSPTGNIIMENNTKKNKEVIIDISNIEYPKYLTEEDKNNDITNIVFRNNNGSIKGDIIPKDLERKINIIVENNKISKIDLNYYNSPWTFDISQLNLESLGNHPFSVGGANIIGSAPYNYRYMPNGGGRYDVGDVIAETNAKKTTCIEEGCMPIQGELKYCNGHGSFKPNTDQNSMYKFISNGNLYITLNKGTLSDTAPTHTEGIELNGDINVLFLSKVCKYETINKN